MPPVRRKAPAQSSASNPRAQQNKLAFGPQNSANRITKASTTAPSSKTLGKKAADKASDAIVEVQPEVTTVENTPSPGPGDPRYEPLLKKDTYIPAATTAGRPSNRRTAKAADPAQPSTKPSKALSIRKQVPPASPPQQPLAKVPTHPSKTAATKPTSKPDLAALITPSQITRYWTTKESLRIAPRVHQKGLTVHEKILREFDASSQFGPCIGIPRMRRWKRADGLGLAPPLEVLAVLMKEEEKGNKAAERAAVEGLLSSRVSSAAE